MPTPIALYWDPSRSHGTLSNDNKTVTDNGSGWSSNYGEQGRATGLWYFETSLDVLGGRCTNGVGNASANTGSYVGNTSDSWGVLDSGVKYNRGGKGSAGTGQYVQGDIFKCAWNADTGDLWFGKNDTWAGDPEAGTGAVFSGISDTLFPAFGPESNSEQATLRVLDSEFSYAPPTGFSAWGGATAATAVTGSLAATLANAVAASAGNVSLSASLSAALSNVATASAGKVSLAASLAASLGNAALSAAGHVVAEAITRTGTLAVTLGSTVLSAAAKVAVRGSGAPAGSNATTSSAGRVSTKGALSAMLADAITRGGASALSARAGVAAILLGNATTSATGTAAQRVILPDLWGPSRSAVMYEGDGVTKQFVITFPYIGQPDVKVRVNTTLQSTPLAYRFINATVIEFAVAPSRGDAVQLSRLTNGSTALAQFQDGSVLTEAELNLAVLQLLYLIQETRDNLNASVGSGVTRIATGHGITTTTAGDVIDEVTAGILNSQLLADLQQQLTDIATNAATISAQTTRVDTIADALAALATVNGTDIATFLTNEQNARIDGDTATNETIALMGAVSADAKSFVFNLDTVQVSPTLSLGDRLSGLESSIGDNQTTITNEASARVDADGALGTRIDGMLAVTGDNKALILSEQTVRASADSSLASSINTLQSSVGGNTASISTQQTVTNGLSAEYMIKTDVNGYVSGIGLYNQGGSSKFYVLADQFAVIVPGKPATVPFSVDTNGVYINDAYIRNLTVDKINGGSINSIWNLNNTSGRIVIDTGTHMKVIGAGFGANSDLIEWFGVKMAVSSCTKANGITWVGTNGSAYYGGSLSAGTLYNARQSTSVALGIDLTIGPYATNGNAKTIVLSYTYRDFHQGSGSGAGSQGTTATIHLYRTIGTGSETLVATLTATGTWDWHTESGLRYDTTVISGSLTYSDNVAGTATRTYRALLSSRSQGLVQDSGAAQNITLASTEQ